MNTFTILSYLCLCVALTYAQDEAVGQQNQNTSPFSSPRLVCTMEKSCQSQEKCELPCRFQNQPGALKTAEVVTTTNFIDEEFEELWDEMQDRMKGLNEHQTELIAQQHDLLKQQQRLEFENRKLKTKQKDLLERQEVLEQENERLKTLAPGDKDDEELRTMVKNLEAKIKVLTEQQKKLSGQQSRLVEQQNRLMQRQRKLEKENAKLTKRQERIEKIGFGPTTTPPSTTPALVPQKVPELQPIDSRIDEKLNAIKKEMEHRIGQLTGQQEELLKEQTRLINRQMRLEVENEELRSQQIKLYKKQEELEKENQELKANLTHRTEDPEERREKIESSGLCVILHGDICFALLGDGTDELTFELAQKNCKMYGGDLANIYDKEHYEKIKQYFLEKKIASGVWLGMKYQPISYRTTLSEGTEAPFVKWNWVYPVSFASYTSIYLYIDADPESIYSGMVNLPPTWKYPYALCQFGKPDDESLTKQGIIKSVG